MVLEEQILSALLTPSPQLPLGINITPNVAKQNTNAPYAVLRRVSTVPWVRHSGSGYIDRVRIQIDVYALSLSQAASISHSIRQLIESIRTDVTYMPFLEDQSDGYDDELELHVRSSDFICWEHST